LSCCWTIFKDRKYNIIDWIYGETFYSHHTAHITQMWQLNRVCECNWFLYIQTYLQAILSLNDDIVWLHGVLQFAILFQGKSESVVIKTFILCLKFNLFLYDRIKIRNIILSYTFTNTLTNIQKDFKFNFIYMYNHLNNVHVSLWYYPLPSPQRTPLPKEKQQQQQRH
jgi:hypothetical protein